MQARHPAGLASASHAMLSQALAEAESCHLAASTPPRKCSAGKRSARSMLVHTQQPSAGAISLARPCILWG